MQISDVATAFSSGHFSICYDYLTAETLWEIPGQTRLVGKDAIVAYCEKTRSYFDRVVTEFTILDMVVGAHKVAINGTAEFIVEGKHTSRISSCDVYVFTAEGNIQSIRSYCIDTFSASK